MTRSHNLLLELNANNIMIDKTTNTTKGASLARNSFPMSLLALVCSKKVVTSDRSRIFLSQKMARGRGVVYPVKLNSPVVYMQKTSARNFMRILSDLAHFHIAHCLGGYFSPKHSVVWSPSKIWLLFVIPCGGVYSRSLKFERTLGSHPLE